MKNRRTKTTSLPRKVKPESPLGEWVNTSPAFGLLGFKEAQELRNLVHDRLLKKDVHYRIVNHRCYQFHLENCRQFLNQQKSVA